MSNNIHDCSWCHAIDVDYTVGRSGVTFPKACAICGHQEGEYWGWKELRERFDELRAAVKSKDRAIIELCAKVNLLQDKVDYQDKVIEQRNVMLSGRTYFHSDAAVEEENKKLRGLLQWFIDRCDKGEIRSQRTYLAFKKALEEAV